MYGYIFMLMEVSFMYDSSILSHNFVGKENDLPQTAIFVLLLGPFPMLR